VLSNISLEISASEFVSIVGASGCGKTTLLRILDGLIPPSAGEVLIDGKKVNAPGPNRGFVFQKDSLWPWRDTMGTYFSGCRFNVDLAARRGQSHSSSSNWSDSKVSNLTIPINSRAACASA